MNPVNHLHPMAFRDGSAFPPPRDGTLAPVNTQYRGHFLSPPRETPGAPHSVPLSRDARSGLGGGTFIPANRAAYVMTGRSGAFGRGVEAPPIIASLPINDTRRSRERFRV
jgi:hypothetical protein